MSGDLLSRTKPLLARISRFLLAVLCCICAGKVFAYTYNLSPPVPSAGQPVQVIVQGTGYLDLPAPPTVSVSGNAINVVFGGLNDEVIPGKPMVPYTIAFDIGAFAAGTYTVSFYGTVAPGGGTFFLTSQTLVVVDQPPSVPINQPQSVPSGTALGYLLLGVVLAGVAMQRLREYGRIRLRKPSAQAHE